MNKDKFVLRFKSILLIIVIVFTQINSFAAVVSDNDGSSFITKAEFDSLRSTFQGQIDEFNQGIDAKIDSVISNYIAGIKPINTVSNLYDLYVQNNGKKPQFLNKVPGLGSSSNSGEVVINLTREQNINVYNNLYFDAYFWQGSSTAWLWATVYFGSRPNYRNAATSWTNVWYSVKGSTSGDNGSSKGSNLSLSQHSNWSSSTTRNTEYQQKSFFKQENVAGVGSGWVYQKINGEKNLKFYNSQFFPSTTIDIHAHRYSNFGSTTYSYYFSSSGKSDTTAINVTAAKLTKYGSNSGGSKYTGNSTSSGTYYKQTLSKKEVSDGINYTDLIIAKDTNQKLYCFNESIKPTTSDTTSEASVSSGEFYDVYWSSVGGKLQTNTLSGITAKYYTQKFDTESYEINKFHIFTLQSLASERVYHGEGFPILKVINDSNCTVTVKLSRTGSSGGINWKLSDQKLSNNSFQSTAKIKSSGTVSNNGTFSIDLKDAKAGTMLWLNTYAETEGAVATIESVDVKFNY